ncbi:DNA-primase RepB domain-containing protein [Alicyclobacillus fastidiosus]|uniref:DNA-primase RepB domain-containing protein n=1 Tax=Alicyclobacillus fastidiosus TaxID=392011 RepID=UPI0034D51642
MFTDVVARYKEDTLSELRQFPLKPSYVVETRNGLHVYWVLNAGATVEQFKECQRRLIAHFGADPKVKNPARLLRVPGTYWCKEPNNKFLTRLIECDGIRYDINTIIDTWC